jgi:diadenosine tetraphosphatase ApaH/serine/threonine PP2A family protein phosphatase
MTPESGERIVRTRKRPLDEEGITWKPIHDRWKPKRIVGWFPVAVGDPGYDWPAEFAQLDDFEPRKTGIDRSQPTGDKE